MRRYWDGWTLIEVLVVVAIVLVLAGLIYAVGAYAIDRSRQAQCVSNLRQIGIALLQYRNGRLKQILCKLRRSPLAIARVSGLRVQANGLSRQAYQAIPQ